MNVPPKLTDEEICRKFEITVDHPGFAMAKALSHNRVDRIICDVPDLSCPHCGHDFTATYADIDPENGDEIPCPECDRIIHVEAIFVVDENGDLIEPGEDDGREVTISVTLSTHPKDA
jgi:uncharacterized protein (UPF0212 family)